jgi:hypothetical protein
MVQGIGGGSVCEHQILHFFVDIGTRNCVNASNIFDLPERWDTFIIVVSILI